MYIEQNSAKYAILYKQKNKNIVIRIVFSDKLGIYHDVSLNTNSFNMITEENYIEIAKQSIKSRNDINKMCHNGLVLSTRLLDIKTHEGKTYYDFKSSSYSFSYVDNFVDIDKISHMINVYNRNLDIDTLLDKLNNNSNCTTQLDNINDLFLDFTNKIRKIVGSDCNVDFLEDESKKENKFIFCVSVNNDSCFIKADYKNNEVKYNFLYTSNIFDNLTKDKENLYLFDNFFNILYVFLNNTTELLYNNINVWFQETFRTLIFLHLNVNKIKSTYELSSINDDKRILEIYEIEKNDKKYTIGINVYDNMGNLKYVEFNTSVSSQKVNFYFSKFLSLIY